MNHIRNGRKVKSIKVKLIILLIGIVIFFFSLTGYIVYWTFFDINRIPKQLMIEEKTSPNGTYTVKAYLSDMGATTSYSIVAELIFNKENRKAKNIYFKNKQNSVEINWIDNDTVEINGIELDVPYEVYDYRWQ